MGRPRNYYLMPLRLVSFAYFPFLACMVLVSAVLGLLVLAILRGRGAIYLGIMFLVTSVHLLIGFSALFQRVDEDDAFEIELPDKWQPGLAELVEQVASDRELDLPDVIRLHAESLAHVYMDSEGQSILCVGGTLIAALPKRALAGIIAHELSHLTAGDIKRSRRARYWHQVMGNLEEKFLSTRYAVWSPLVWLVRLYHHVYFRLYFASQRCEEFLADSYYVDQVGEEEAATTLVLISVLHHLPSANLANMAGNLAMFGQRIEYFFAEQVKRLRAANKFEWEDAMKKALRRKTEWHSTHPGLKDRLKPLGVKARDVLPLAMNMTGEPATALFANWSTVEKYLSKRLLEIVQIQFNERQMALQGGAAVMKSL